jgi:hypothetical protein
MGAHLELWNEYRATWEAFSHKLDELQACADAGNQERIEAALLDVERARVAHNAARDRLAAHLCSGIAAIDASRVRPQEEVIREKARLIWELSGRPQGSAEADWLSAERVVRSAATVN